MAGGARGRGVLASPDDYYKVTGVLAQRPDGVAVTALDTLATRQQRGAAEAARDSGLTVNL